MINKIEVDTEVIIINQEDTCFRNVGKIVKNLEHAYFNFVVEFPDGDIGLYRKEDIEVYDINRIIKVSHKEEMQSYF
jgi:hypothetical protein